MWETGHDDMGYSVSNEVLRERSREARPAFLYAMPNLWHYGPDYHLIREHLVNIPETYFILVLLFLFSIFGFKVWLQILHTYVSIFK